MQDLLYTESPTRQIMYAWGSNLLLNVQVGKQFGNNKIYFMYPVLICEIIMAAFVLNSTFRSALSKIIVYEHRELWSRMRLRLMSDWAAMTGWPEKLQVY